MEELFQLLTKNIHFNVTELSSKTWNQNWRVPEGLISIIGIKMERIQSSTTELQVTTKRSM